MTINEPTTQSESAPFAPASTRLKKPSNPASRFIALTQALLVVSSLALVFSVHLPARLLEAIAAYFSLNLDTSSNQNSFLTDWDAPFPAFVLLAWLVWLIAALFLLKFPSRTSRASVEFTPVAVGNTTRGGGRADQKWWGWGLTGLALLGVLAVAYGQRAAQLLPDASGQLPASNYDEMVYLSGASLLGQGAWPYHDFLLAHPPGAVALFGAWLKLWGQSNGGYNAFILTRSFSVALGLATTGGIFLTAGRMWSRPGQKFATLAGAGAALVYATDVRASQVALLETVSNFWAVWAVLVFVEVSHLPQFNKWHRWLLFISGALAASAFLAKLPGLALVVALLAYLFWQNWRQKTNLVWLSAGFGAGTVLISGLFMLKGGVGAFLRQVVFFQLLRPQEVRSGIDEVARISDYTESRLTLLLAALAVLVISWQLVTLADKQVGFSNLGLVPLFWSGPLLAVFIFGKSFHPWYYVQWALPLALLIGGLFQLPSFQASQTKSLTANLKRVASFKSGLGQWSLGLFVLTLLMLPAFVTEWQVAHAPAFDQSYQAVAAYIGSQPGTTKDKQLLAFDPGYDFMSRLKPAQLPVGKYLVDSAGYMTYLNLGLDQRGLLPLFADALNAKREQGQVVAVFHAARAQALVTEAVKSSAWVVLDVKLGLAQLTPQTVEFLESNAVGTPVQVGSNLVWRTTNASQLREYSFANGLQMLPLNLSLAQGQQANVVRADTSGVLSLTPAQLKEGVLAVRLIWRVVRQPTQPAKLFVHLINSGGQIVAQSDLAPLQGQSDIQSWQPGEAYQDLHSLPLPANLAAGRYSVQIGLYNPSNGQRVLVEGQDNLTLGSVVIGTSR